MSAAATNDESRLLKLEEKVAYQDKIIHELNEVVVALLYSEFGGVEVIRALRFGGGE